VILSFLENIHKKPLAFGHMDENKIFFFVFLNIFFLKKKSDILILGLYLTM